METYRVGPERRVKLWTHPVSLAEIVTLKVTVLGVGTQGLGHGG